MPKNAACPSDIRPVYPTSRFRLIAKMAKIRISEISPSV